MLEIMNFGAQRRHRLNVIENEPDASVRRAAHARHDTEITAGPSRISWAVSMSCHESLPSMASNAPVQARWAHAQRAGPAPPNPPPVACNRPLGGASRLAMVRWRNSLPRRLTARASGLERLTSIQIGGSPAIVSATCDNTHEKTRDGTHDQHC